MGDRRVRIDLVQGDAKRLEFHVVRTSPTAAATPYNLASLATAWYQMRLQPSGVAAVTTGGSVVDATAGHLNVTIGTQHSATFGRYDGELVLDWGPGIGRETIPKDNPFMVVIRANV